MDRTPYKLRSCESKRPHPTLESSELERRAMSERTGDNGLASYRCEFCGQWHVGHGTTRRQRKAESVRSLRELIAEANAPRRDRSHLRGGLDF